MPDVLTAFGLSASAGLNAYIPLLVIALAARYTDLITLVPPYDVLTDGWVIGVIVVLLVVEVLADKVPMIDHINDIVGTVVRPAAGAIVFAAAMTGAISTVDPRLALILGAVTAGATHGAKATARPVVTATTGGIGNPVVSTLEDIAALLTSLLALLAPAMLALALVLFVALVLIGARRRRRGGAGAASVG
jgi:hypothetical protein